MSVLQEAAEVLERDELETIGAAVHGDLPCHFRWNALFLRVRAIQRVMLEPQTWGWGLGGPVWAYLKGVYGWAVAPGSS